MGLWSEHRMPGHCVLAPDDVWKCSTTDPAGIKTRKISLHLASHSHFTTLMFNPFIPTHPLGAPQLTTPTISLHIMVSPSHPFWLHPCRSFQMYSCLPNHFLLAQSISKYNPAWSQPFWTHSRISLRTRHLVYWPTIRNILPAWGPFLEAPSNFTGLVSDLKAKFQAK